MSQNVPPKSSLMILSWRFCHVRSQGKESRTTQSGGVRSNSEYRQSKLPYPLGLTVIGCLHKHKDPIKPKDPMSCRIWLLFLGSIPTVS